MNASRMARHSPPKIMDATTSPAVAVLTAEAEVSGVLPEWGALWDRVPDASPFISPDWLWSWWRHLGGGALRVFTARAGGRLVAVLPMFIWDDAGMRRLLPLGISVSDAFDLLAEPAWRRAVQDLLGPLLCHGDDWDRCELHEVPQDSALLWLAATGPSPVVQRQSMSPVLDIGTFATRGSRSAPIRKLRRAWTRANALGHTHVEHLTGDAPSHRVADAMEQLFRLHSAQWQARGETGVLAGSTLRAFHSEVATKAAARGTLHLLVLHVGGKIAGVFHGFIRGKHAYAYASGTDPKLAHIGPGTLLVGAAIEAAQAAGARDFDFLRGQEPYKYDWGAVDRPTMLITLGSSAQHLGTARVAHSPHGATRTIRMTS